MTEDEVKKVETEKIMREKARAYKRFSKTGDGKVILKDLINFCGQNKTSISSMPTGIPIDPYQTHVNEGKRRVYLRFDSMINRKEDNA